MKVIAQTSTQNRNQHASPSLANKQRIILAFFPISNNKHRFFFVLLLRRRDFQAGVLKLAQDLWCGQESSRPAIPDFVIIDGHVADCRAPSKGPSIAKGGAIITLDEEDTFQKDDSSSDTTTASSIVCDSVMTDREDGTKQQEEEEKEDEEKEEVRGGGPARSSGVFNRTEDGWQKGRIATCALPTKRPSLLFHGCVCSPWSVAWSSCSEPTSDNDWLHIF